MMANKIIPFMITPLSITVSEFVDEEGDSVSLSCSVAPVSAPDSAWFSTSFDGTTQLVSGVPP